MVHEIQAIITAAQAEYQRFAATAPDGEIRAVVSNAVTFLAADLTSAAQWAASTEKRN
ncbi:hypothetical protein SAMN05421630_111137 [Prauserella marina]|uniref:Uncharacterized protein n=1 Tax=Prauserella marina TaxID=530584 RepID=A0A1G6WXS8_9PSEU|nr:hypothetical protein [Prauserella marina]PWV73186.1 hypothetical protein DES30_109136 [Prauserella marina]SDD69856.1 hypothetical protein SAMN05421630_111137 [Prauserella marina]